MKKKITEMIELLRNGHVYTFPHVVTEFYGKPGWASLFTMEGYSFAVTWVGTQPQAYGGVGRLERIVEEGRVMFQATTRPAPVAPTASVQPSAKRGCSTTPIGSAFAANSELIMSSIEQAAAASAAKMGDDALKLFSTETGPLTKQIQRVAKTPAKAEVKQNNGSNGSYYEVDCVSHKDGREYLAECQDIIDALQMTFNEGNTFKSLWRLAAARLGKVKGEGGKELYDAQKVEFYGKRVLKAQEAKQ